MIENIRLKSYFCLTSILLPWNQTGVSTWNVRPEHTLCTERDKLMQSCLTGLPHGRLLDKWARTQEHSSSVELQLSQGEDEEIR